MTDTEHILMAIVDHVAEQKGVPPNSLDPLYDAIDPDALNKLFTTSGKPSTHAVQRVVFEYSGYEVTVTNDGDVFSEQLETH